MVGIDLLAQAHRRSGWGQRDARNELGLEGLESVV